jgi:hypothetical protein
MFPVGVVGLGDLEDCQLRWDRLAGALLTFS